MIGVLTESKFRGSDCRYPASGHELRNTEL